jgi:IMP and pyridine-specific 5'-nucleotidase
VGDRFTDSGNDSAARHMVPILWMSNPQETGFFISMILDDMTRARHDGRYIE